MRYKLLGPSGLRVSELCLGTMTFGEDWGWGAAREECAAIVEAFGEAGGNFIDTAHFYTNGTSERIVGELIAPDRDHWVLATKYGLTTRPDDPNAGGAHRKSIVRQLESSLERLGTDYVDVYWLHVWDAFTPVEEVVDALDDLVRAGKVLYVGISDTPAWVVSRAVTMAELRGRAGFVGLQVPYSLVRREVERDLLPMARTLELTVTTWEPLGGGLLGGRYGTGRELPDGTRIATSAYAQLLSERNLRIADRVNEVAAERGASSAQAALAWVRAQQERAAIVPIVGARRREQIEDSLGALEVELSAAELERLDEASRIELGFPHDFEGRALAYGDTYSQVDDQRRGVYREPGIAPLEPTQPGDGRGAPGEPRERGTVLRHVVR
jgi:aryl-alcohol dehydrogenase-like predicted oxidoreductase